MLTLLAKISVLEIVLYILLGVGTTIWVIFTILDFKKKKKKETTEDDED